MPDGRGVPLAHRDAAMLAWLVLEGPTQRARLATLLWPDAEPDAARNSLRQRLFQLKRQFGTALVRGSYLISLADGTTHDLDEADTVLGSECLPIGPEFDAWLGQQRARRRARLRQAFVELSEMAEATRDYADALTHAGEALALEPLSEDAHRRMMRLHYLAGDRAAALLAFDRCERILKDEVGARPSPDTLSLLQTIERAAPDASTRPTPAVPPALTRPPRLIGRDAERTLLASAAADGALVLVFGEAGMGKTRLLADLVDAQDAAKGRLLMVCARPGDAGVPLALVSRLLRGVLQRQSLPPGPLRDDLARLLPELGSRPAHGREWTREHDRARLAGAVETLLGQAVAGGLRTVVVDDLQYADEASVALLQSLVGGRTCGWVLAMRPGELGPAARGLVDAHGASAQVDVLRLQPLDAPGIEVLLDTLEIDGIGGSAQAEGLLKRTGGNPLFLLETLKSALTHKPGKAVAVQGTNQAATINWPSADNVLRLIQQRIARLSPLALKLARCAAVAGQDLSLPLAEQVLGLRPLDLADAWSELEAAQVLHGGGFEHDLIAEAALASLPDMIARSLHAEVAAFLERVQGEPARIAEHWLAAGEPLKAVPQLAAAARRASAGWHGEDAARMHEQAAVLLLNASDRRGAFDAYFAAADALSDVVVDQRMVSYGEALAGLAEDDGQRAMAALVQILLLGESRQIDEALLVVLEALPRAEHAGLPDIEVELLWSLTILHWERREIAEAARRAEQGLRRLKDVDPLTARRNLRHTRLKLTHALGRIFSATGHYRQGDVQLVEAYRLAGVDQNLAAMADIASTLALCALEQGELARGLDWSRQAMAQFDSKATMTSHSEAGCASARALLLAANGDLGGALVAADLAALACNKGYVRKEVQIMQQCHWLHGELGRHDLAVKGLHVLRGRGNLSRVERVLIDATLLHMGEAGDSMALLDQVGSIDDFPLRACVLCLAQPGCDPAQILPLLALSAAAARDQGAHGLWLALQTRRMAALRALERAEEASEVAISVWRRVEQGVVGIELFPRMAAELCAALAPARNDLAQVIALRASAWMQSAASTLPPGWRGVYLQRAPTLALLNLLQR